MTSGVTDGVGAGVGGGPVPDARRLSALVEATGQALYRMGPDWAAVERVGNPGGAQPFGAWLEAAVMPEDRDAVRAAVGAGRAAGRPFEVEHRVPGRAGPGWARLRAAPLIGADGAVEDWMAASLDVTARREAEAQGRLLLAELQHRVRNTLAVIRSIVRRSAASSRSAADLATHLEGRIAAVARVQSAAIRAPGLGVELEGLLRDEFLAAAVGEDRLRVDGPPVRLAPQAAEALALAFHELTVNAIKHGALSGPTGRIEVGWTVDGAGGDARLRLAWAERGRGPGRPRRRGFGTELLERTLPYSLGARTSLTYGPDGFHCRIELPLGGARVQDGEGAAPGGAVRETAS